jgi:superfamily I DNA/RNA helicase
LNHFILGKITRSGKTKVIAVGDPCQAIYGFRGADTRSMGKLRNQYNADTLYLTTSFRCAVNICAEARWRAPDMQSPAWAKEGLVLTPDRWTAEDVPDQVFIVCRNNAPIYSMALRLLVAGRKVELW